MKYWVILLFLSLLPAAPSAADVVSAGLPASTDAAVVEGARAMVAAGVDSAEAVRMTRAMLQNQYHNQQIIAAQNIAVKASRQVFSSFNVGRHSEIFRFFRCFSSTSRCRSLNSE